ncbi:MAG TPA: GNAT family N-acetyltransferase [Caulobacteraceae bacterium]|jgi:RimJ/RimL family protein N-acetyltransferase
MIETERLTLRPFVEADRADWMAMVTDPEVAEPLGGARIQAPDYFDGVLTFWATYGHGPLALLRRSDGALIGRVGIRRQPPEWAHPMMGEVEVGWMLARPAWGEGYATEAARAALAWGFETLGVPQIFSWTTQVNVRSQAVMRRLGMRRVAERDFLQPGRDADDPLGPHVVFVIGRDHQ